jgi:hypothetical protein
MSTHDDARLDNKLLTFWQRLTSLPAHLASTDQARQLCEQFEALTDTRNALRREGGSEA